MSIDKIVLTKIDTCIRCCHDMHLIAGVRRIVKVSRQRHPADDAYSSVLIMSFFVKLLDQSRISTTSAWTTTITEGATRMF